MKATICLLAAGLGLFGQLGLLGQSRPAPAPPAFEVASVKPAGDGPNGVRGGCHGIDTVYSPTQQGEAPPLGRCVITDARLSHLISIAWGLPSMTTVQSGPEWIARGTERFNVEAKAEAPSKTTGAQLLSMLQALLIERFQLKFHHESKDLPGFAVVVAKGGPKLQPSRSEETKVSFTNPAGGEVLKHSGSGPVSMTARKYSVAALVNLLSQIGGLGPGVDKTGLTGAYDFSLAWDPDAGPSLATALRDQLGLRVQSEKVSVPYFVIDSATRPSAN